MMNKKKFCVLAAALLAAAVVVSGCQQQQKPADPGTPTPTPPVKPDDPKPDTNTGSAIEFTGNLEIGQVVVSIKDGVVTVWYRRSPDNTVYVGNGMVGAKGAVSFDLHAVDNAEDKIPFKGTYHYTKATEAQSFDLTQLTASYPYAPVPLTHRHQGNVQGYQKHFVRYVQKLKNSLNGKNDIAGAFFVTLDTDKVLITAVYGNDGIGMSSVSKTANLEGNVVHTEMVLGATKYRIKLVFNEDERDGSGTSDENTVWYLGSKNPRYVDAVKTPSEPQYIGGFYIYEASEVGPDKPFLRDDMVTEKRGLKLYTDDNTTELGTLDIIIRGPKVTFVMYHTDNETTAGESKGERQEKHIMLEASTLRPPYYDSVAMKSAQVKTAGAAPEDSVRVTDETVFVFKTTTDATAAPGGPNPKNNVYNTFDFKITEYDPVNHRLCLTGKYLNGKKPGTTEHGGENLIGNSGAGGKTIHLYKSRQNSVALDSGMSF